MMMQAISNDNIQSARDFSIPLDDGTAELVGEGTFVLFQESANGTQSVVVTTNDLAKMLQAAEQ